MKNEAGFAGQMLSIVELAKLDHSDLQGAGFYRSPHYRGPAECFDDEFEARAMLVELARYFCARPPGVSDLYFIGAEVGPIKIGVAGEPRQRLRQLQTANPYKLHLLAVLPYGGLQEGEYHARFAAHRLEGEWFERHPDILNEIERLRSVAA